MKNLAEYEDWLIVRQTALFEEEVLIDKIIAYLVVMGEVTEYTEFETTFFPDKVSVNFVDEDEVVNIPISRLIN